MKVHEVLKYIDSLEPVRDSEEGIRYGNDREEVSGILVCWMASLDALKKAIKEKCNLVICHESLFFPNNTRADAAKGWKSNDQKMRVMDSSKIAVFRAHLSLDRLCIFDDFARILGLEKVVAGEGWHRIFLISETKLGDLAQEVKKKVGLKKIRVVGKFSHKVSKVGLPWGGLGLSCNITFWEPLVANGANVVIAGEMDEYSMWYAVDSGLDVIETSHAVSENIGIRNFTKRLQDHFPKVKLLFFNNNLAYHYI